MSLIENICTKFEKNLSDISTTPALGWLAAIVEHVMVVGSPRKGDQNKKKSDETGEDSIWFGLIWFTCIYLKKGVSLIQG